MVGAEASIPIHQSGSWLTYKINMSWYFELLTGLDNIGFYVPEHGVNLLPHKLGRHMVDAIYARGVLRRQGRGGRHGIAAMGRDDLLIRLQASALPTTRGTMVSKAAWTSGLVNESPPRLPTSSPTPSICILVPDPPPPPPCVGGANHAPSLREAALRGQGGLHQVGGHLMGGIRVRGGEKAGRQENASTKNSRSTRAIRACNHHDLSLPAAAGLPTANFDGLRCAHVCARVCVCMYGGAGRCLDQPPCGPGLAKERYTAAWLSADWIPRGSEGWDGLQRRDASRTMGLW
jgi:hypothetical protein